MLLIVDVIVKIRKIVRGGRYFSVDTLIIMGVVALPGRQQRFVQPHPLIYAIEAPDKVHVPHITAVDYLLLVSSA